MSKMKAGVVVFPGSNCDRDMQHVLQDVLGIQTIFLWHKESNLQNCDLVVLPGGFSYGDYLRSGAIARFSPIMNQVMEHADRGGLLLGICNGFQILCESGLLPGALLHNLSQTFICRNVFIRAEHNQNVLTSKLKPGRALQIPIAHGEGRYFDHPDALNKLEENNQVLFRYCNEHGEVTPAANPNGSERGIAGICNTNGNVFGMMPHPERASEELLRNSDGRALFEGVFSRLSEA